MKVIAYAVYWEKELIVVFDNEHDALKKANLLNEMFDDDRYKVEEIEKEPFDWDTELAKNT